MKITNKNAILSIPNDIFFINPRDISEELLTDNDVIYKLLSVYEGLFFKFYNISDDWKLEFLKKVSKKDYFNDNLYLFNDNPVIGPGEIRWRFANTKIPYIDKYISHSLLDRLSLDDMSIHFAYYCKYGLGFNLVEKFGTSAIISKYGTNSIPFIVTDAYTHCLRPAIIGKRSMFSILTLCETYYFSPRAYIAWNAYVDSTISITLIKEFLTCLLSTNNYSVLNHINLINGTASAIYSASIYEMAEILKLIQQIMTKNNDFKFLASHHMILSHAISKCNSDNDILLLLEDPTIFKIYPISYFFDPSIADKYAIFKELFIEKFNSYLCGQ